MAQQTDIELVRERLLNPAGKMLEAARAWLWDYDNVQFCANQHKGMYMEMIEAAEVEDA